MLGAKTCNAISMTQRYFWKLLTRVHKWAGLILGAQIFVWFMSGFFMTLFPIDDVRGRHLAEQTEWSLTDIEIIPIELVMDLYLGELTGATLTSHAGQPAYALIGDSGTQLVNARTGENWTPITEKEIGHTALEYYKGTGKIVHMVRLSDTPSEYRGKVPVWQVQFNDSSKTRLYLDAETARLKAVRTKLWRVYDFMWMLHIMDYTREDDFHSWWLRLAACLSLLFAISGILLVIHRVLLRPKTKILT